MNAKLKLAEEYATFLGINVKDTNIRMARRTIVSRMSAASKEWDEAVAGFEFGDHRKTSSELGPQNAEDNLTAWLENMNLDSDEPGESRALSTEHMHMTHPKVNPNDVDLYRCSWCKNPSAVLRKCSTCESTR